ncbi:MAG: hypothetical protein MJ183_08240 [Treponemataceae bacterium]|nr:hypothetical protein [Treponemataceae bacterium]
MKLVLIPHKDTISLLERAGLAEGLLLQPLFCTIADLKDSFCGQSGSGARPDLRSMRKLLDSLKEALRGSDTGISILSPELEDRGQSLGTVAVCRVEFGFSGIIRSVLEKSALKTAEICDRPEIPVAISCKALSGDDAVFPLVSKVFRLGLVESADGEWHLLDSVWIRSCQSANSPKAS